MYIYIYSVTVSNGRVACVRPSVCCLLSVCCLWRIYSGETVRPIEQKLVLTSYRKSYMRNRLVPKWMTLTFA